VEGAALSEKPRIGQRTPGTPAASRFLLRDVSKRPWLYRIVRESEFVAPALFRDYYESPGPGLLRGVRVAQLAGEGPHLPLRTRVSACTPYDSRSAHFRGNDVRGPLRPRRVKYLRGLSATDVLDSSPVAAPPRRAQLLLGPWRRGPWAPAAVMIRVQCLSAGDCTAPVVRTARLLQRAIWGSHCPVPVAYAGSNKRCNCPPGVSLTCWRRPPAAVAAVA